jgi:hypothetical protein
MKLLKAESVRVYPNPVTDQLNIYYGTTAGMVAGPSYLI